MTILIAVAVFLPLLALLVVVHEFGHFFTARAFGVKVLEFGFGFPPRLFGIRTGRTRALVNGLTHFHGVASIGDIPVGSFVKLGLVEGEGGVLVARTVEVHSRKERPAKGQELTDGERPDELRTEGIVRAIEGDTLVVADMLYSINLVPLGGFVRLAGESNPRVPRSLASKGTGPRFAILSAGAFMNAVLAIVILASIFMVPQDVKVGDVLVNEVAPGSPAEIAGVRSGDIIVKAGGRTVENIGDLSRAVTLSLGSRMEWQVQRNGEIKVFQVTPRWDPPEGETATGSRPELVNASIASRADPPWSAVYRAFTTIGDMFVLTKNEFSRWFSGGEAPELAGPVGIAQVTGEVARQGNILAVFGLAGFLSMNLAIVNILPIPMLDGGRLVFVGIEWVRRGKRVSPEKEGLVHIIGFALLITLILVISYLDILRIARGDSLLG